jgi:hypothetical protein
MRDRQWAIRPCRAQSFQLARVAFQAGAQGIGQVVILVRAEEDIVTAPPANLLIPVCQ